MPHWTIELDKRAGKQIIALAKKERDRVMTFLRRLADTDNPRATGKALQGRLAGYWRYRVGDYRIICQIKDGELTRLAIEIDQRKDIYR